MAVLELLKRGAVDEAAALALQRCEDITDDAEAWFLLGTARHRLGLDDEALDAFQKAQQLAPADVRPRSAIGAMLGAAGKTAQALETFVAALALQPEQPRLLINAAIALEALGRDNEALAHYDRALAVFPRHGRCLAEPCGAQSAPWPHGTGTG